MKACHAAGSAEPFGVAPGLGGSKGESALIVEHLNKRFGDRVAFDDVSFEVGDREVFGFLEPNGAGKTTTVRTPGTLIVPGSGSAVVAELSLSAKNGSAIRSRISIWPACSASTSRPPSTGPAAPAATGPLPRPQPPRDIHNSAHPAQPGTNERPGSFPRPRRQRSAPGRPRQGRLRHRCAGAPRPLTRAVRSQKRSDQGNGAQRSTPQNGSRGRRGTTCGHAPMQVSGREPGPGSGARDRRLCAYGHGRERGHGRAHGQGFAKDRCAGLIFTTESGCIPVSPGGPRDFPVRRHPVCLFCIRTPGVLDVGPDPDSAGLQVQGAPRLENRLPSVWPVQAGATAA
jgi:energy-coupling factor transporter ATP-binding protein EcfA2